MRDEPIQTADHDRHPALSEEGRRLLLHLREHPHAPIYRNESGHRLRPPEVEHVRAHEREVMAAPVRAAEGGPPEWLESWVQRCYELVPHFRARGVPPERFEDLPTVDRGDLGRDIARFVPDDVPLERLIHFRTSGTTGHPLLIASHPVVAARYLGYHRRALRRFGVELRHGRGQMGVVLLGHQRVCFTYVSVTPTQDEAGLAKINLHPDDWRHPDDRARYIDALAPEVLAGDPLSYAVLLDLPVTCRPRALLCTSMTLLPGLRDRLADRFGCPVLDLYSMNEAGPIAVADPAVGGHVLLQPRMHVEILDPAGRPVPCGQRGEITLTGGFNFCLPLLRYRTGDYASLGNVDGEPVLMGLEGRPPVRFRTRTGDWVNNIEVTHLLRPFALARFRLHQHVDGALQFGWDGAGIDGAELRRTLMTLFGADQPLTLDALPPEPAKQVQYTSDLPEAFP